MSVAVASPYPSAYPIHSEKQQQQQQQQQSRQGTASPIETKPRTVHPLRHHPLNPTAIDGLALAATVAFQEILCFPDPHVRTFSLFAKRLLNATFTATNHSNERTALSLAAAVLFSRRWASRFVSSDLQVSCEGFEFRVFTVSLLLAHKVLEDVSLVRTHEWAKVCGAVHITSGQLARMELEFLSAIEFNASASVPDLLCTVSVLSSILESYRTIQPQHVSASLPSYTSLTGMHAGVSVLAQVHTSLLLV